MLIQGIYIIGKLNLNLFTQNSLIKTTFTKDIEMKNKIVISDISTSQILKHEKKKDGTQM